MHTHIFTFNIDIPKEHERRRIRGCSHLFQNIALRVPLQTDIRYLVLPMVDRYTGECVVSKIQSLRYGKCFTDRFFCFSTALDKVHVMEHEQKLNCFMFILRIVYDVYMFRKS